MPFVSQNNKLQAYTHSPCFPISGSLLSNSFPSENKEPFYSTMPAHQPVTPLKSRSRGSGMIARTREKPAPSLLEPTSKPAVFPTTPVCCALGRYPSRRSTASRLPRATSCESWIGGLDHHFTVSLGVWFLSLCSLYARMGSGSQIQQRVLHEPRFVCPGLQLRRASNNRNYAVLGS